MNSLYRTKSFQSVAIRTKPFYWFSKSRWLYWGTSSYMKPFSTTVALNHVHTHLRHPTWSIYLYHVFIQPCRFLVFFSPSELGTLITFLCQWPFENGSSFCFGQRIRQMDLLHLLMQWQMPKQINHRQNCLTAFVLAYI